MQKWTDILEAWRTLPTTPIKRSTIKTDPALQPRSLQAVAFKQRDKARNESEAHIAALADRLRACQDLDPILVAEIDGRLYVVDGHHRTAAYKDARKGVIPARILKTDWPAAVAISKIVNLDHRALRMHRDQAREACWQYLAIVTRRGRIPHGDTTSCRKAAAMFNVSPDTAHRMIRALPGVNLRGYRREALDPGTEWPLWRYCKGNADPFDMAPDHARAEKQAEKIAALLGKADADINTAALLRLLRQCPTEPGDLPPPLPELVAHYSR